MGGKNILMAAYPHADWNAGAGQLKLHISGLLPHEKTSTVRLIKAIGKRHADLILFTSSLITNVKALA